MGKLAEWCVGKEPWAIDAMQRAATSTVLTAENVTAVVNRVALANGLTVEGQHPCQPFNESMVAELVDTPDDVVLRSVGPLLGLDRLIPDQILKFATNGVTVIFGENGSGKSGYTRALRQLCCARKEPELQSDVFAGGAEPAKSITYTFQQGTSSPTTDTWNEGDPKPSSLAGITLLDTDNLRVYVENKNEILYLPPEVACVGRLADIYRAAATRFHEWIDINTLKYGDRFGAHYQDGTTAAKLSARLQITTAEANLPTEHELREAAVWTAELAEEMTRLGEQIVRGPEALARQNDRIAAACNAVAEDLGLNIPVLDDAAIAPDFVLVQTLEEKRRIADTLRGQQIGSQPIAATGSDSWKALFQWARQFAAEAGLRLAGEPFVIGDPCPLCQQILGDDAVKRLAAFDAYLEGRATTEAQSAHAALQARIATLRALKFKADSELEAFLGEAAALSPASAQLAQRTIAYGVALRVRRDARLQQLEAGQPQLMSPLPVSPIDELRALAASLNTQSAALRSGDDQTTRANSRIAELNAQRLFHEQIEEAVARRNALLATHLFKKCESALNTGPLSRLITTLRKELTSPELKARIEAEISGFDLKHIPLSFSDESEKGLSYFEIGLATEKRAKKSRVLSEGEQRALSLACFLAESHVAGRKSGIILDDPVTSLDHGRVRRVARRLVEEAGKGRQIVIFTHNLVFYHELMLACGERTDPVPALPCLIQQGRPGEFGLVTVGGKPWVARKVTEREQILKAMIDDISDDLAPTSEDYRRHCTRFYASLRETWERAVEELVLNDVVRRFGSDVGTLRLAGVEVSDDDYMVIHRAMKRASEHSGHDQAAGRQIDVPIKAQMMADLNELVVFRARKKKANQTAEERRKAMSAGPPLASAD